MSYPLQNDDGGYYAISQSQNNFDEYIVRLKCLLPVNAHVPCFIKKGHGVNLPVLQFRIQDFLYLSSEVIQELENTTTWASDTNKQLRKVAHSLFQIRAELNCIDLAKLNVVKNQNERYQHYNEYFGVTETNEMDTLELAQVDAMITYCMLLEFQNINIDEFEVSNFLRGVILRWEVIASVITGIGANATDSNSNELPHYIDTSLNDPIVNDCRITTCFFRWMISHYDFALNAMYATMFSKQAKQELEDQNYHEAAMTISKIGVAVRATTVSMVLGSMMPKAVYQNYIRPSMGVGFTGKDNLWWSAFMNAKRELLACASINKSGIVKKSLVNLQEILLQDIELHTWVAAKLVGNKTSLTIDEINEFCDEQDKSERFATADLRTLFFLRVKEFDFLSYYPIVNQLFKADSK
ncbi:hypothetical protein [Runella sp. SP2]|uniref:hypothetical protein n=1 Tax=Runella sp. SP2 TaxID=2268026 RepID=UPI000F0919D0|nr:hypothetical protein [Runella sp. SP2]AYQ31030.1 hypothetical protein DTQ70_02035 [Runella sp. SP2]